MLNVDVNFDEYDKSDDPQDYKFVRWLTKEKVLSFLLLLTFTLIITALYCSGPVNIVNVICLIQGHTQTLNQRCLMLVLVLVFFKC